MTGMWRIGLVPAVALLLATAPAAHARETVRSLIEDGRGLLEKKEFAAGLGKLADAVALAQKRGDLLEEQEAALALEEAVGPLKASPAAEAPVSSAGEPPELRTAMFLILKRIEPKRNGAFVCASVLARNLLLLAPEMGDTAHLEEALEILASRARAKDGGRADAVLASYAIGMKAVLAGEPAKATGPLGDALDGACAEQWGAVATHAAVERAAAWLAMKKPEEARGDMEKAATLCLTLKDVVVLARWRKAVDGRLTDAPEEVRAPLAGVLGKFKGSAPGPGGAGKSSDRPPLSPFGRAYPRIPKSGPILQVAREEDGFSVREYFNREYRGSAPFGDMVRFFEAEGIFLAMEQTSVSLHRLDLEGGMSKPGDGFEVLPVRAFRLLARGERWTLFKNGTVTVGK